MSVTGEKVTAAVRIGFNVMAAEVPVVISVVVLRRLVKKRR